MAQLYGLLGDLVNSRATNRTTLHTSLEEILAAELVSQNAVEAVHPSVGDEIQGIFQSFGAAVRASHLIRLKLLAAGFDIRFGIGAGEISIIDAKNNIQDGSAWWRARKALEASESTAQMPGFGSIRTSYEAADEQELINAQLQLIDSAISSLKPSAVKTLLGLVLEEANQVTAEKIGISASANSHRIKRENLRPLNKAIKALWQLEHP